MSRLAERLLGLKASQLRHISFLLGLTSTGSKTELSKAIQSQLIPPIPTPEGPNRILSIDMGIKNLGLCVLEPKRPDSPSISSNKLRIKVLDWRRINLLSSPTTQPAPSEPVKLDFSPSILSKLAVQTTESFLSTYSPSTILIERQRFRSGGAAAVQEWTLRVNMLESMLWATLECLRTHVPSRPSSNGKPGWDNFPQAHEVLPARVADFWCSAPAGFRTLVSPSLFDVGISPTEEREDESIVHPISDPDLKTEKLAKLVSQISTEEMEDEDSLIPEAEQLVDKKKNKRAIDIKKEKIAVVRSWLATSNIATKDDADTQIPQHGIELEISESVIPLAEAFLHGKDGSKKGKPISEGQKSSKLDDLADSLLQGVAWLRWRENERRMREMLKSELEEAGG